MLTTNIFPNILRKIIFEIVSFSIDYCVSARVAVIYEYCAEKDGKNFFWKDKEDKK